jgi:CRP-like cAMP-binding protein
LTGDRLSREATPVSAADREASFVEAAPLFAGLDDAERVALRRLFSVRACAPGETLVLEGETDTHVYVLAGGRARVVKRSADGDETHEVAILGDGDTIGEMKLADFRPNSATVIAVDRLTAWALDVEALARRPELANARATILANVARILAARLRRNTEVAAEAMHNELRESRARVSAAQFVVYLFALLATYSLGVSLMQEISADVRPSQTIVSAVGIFCFTIPIYFLVTRSPFPRAAYGLTLVRWREVAVEAVLYTIPVLVALALIKLAFITWSPGLAGEPLIRFDAVFGGRPFDLRFYALAVFLYAALAPVQELFNRAGLQGSLEKFLRVPAGRTNWPAIITSNLIFASLHTYIGVRFAAAAFLPGLFWGWLYDRQRSLVGVSVSHAMVGVWALFVLGYQVILGGE